MRLLRVLVTYLLFWLGLPFILGHPKLRRGVRARLGWHPVGWPELRPGPRLWIHGASAGDILALCPLASAVSRLLPDVRIVASTITNSGRAMAERQGNTFAAITYLPYDLPGAV